MINDILDLSKIEANTLEFVWSYIDINKLFKDLEETIKFKNQDNSKVRINFIPGLPQCIIQTEKIRISQVMNNFLTNALKFTEEGSIDFGYNLESDGIYFYCKDTGCGIPPKNQAAVFDRFVKLDTLKQCLS